MNDPQRREAMRQAMRSLARTQAGDAIARLLEDLVPARRLGRN